MKNMVQKRCELLAENRNLLHKGFMMESSLIKAVAAASFAQKEETVDVEKIKECRKILRKKQGALSYFRGNNELVISSRMALSSNPEKYIDDVTYIYDRMQEGKFFGSSYRVLAAITICDAGKASEVETILDRTNAIMKGMNDVHPFLTNDEDTCFAVILAMTDKSIEEILSEVEETFKYIKKNFTFHENAAYSLSQVLTTYSGSSEAKADKALEILDAFKEADVKYGKDHELASLGVLVNLNMNTKDIASEVIEAADFLKSQKGFGILDMSNQSRLMLGTMVVSGAYADDSEAVNATVTSGALATVIAQQMMFIAIMAASASITATSSSSK